jgi:hypothetical protein
MRSIEVFYHVFIPADIRYTQWNWWIDQQLTLLKTSKLADIANINMAITMPRFYSEIMPGSRIPFRINEQKQTSIVFEQKVREYINLRYPFVNIIDVRDTGEPNIFEGQTLKLLWDKCQTIDADVLYFHSKGIVSAGPQVACWRDILNYFCIEEWANCVSKLDSHDLVGIADFRTSENNTVSGNFWWSKSEYIRTLPNPMLGEIHNRYAYEHWIMTGSPDIFFTVDTKTDHHDNYCFLEDILKLHR